MRTPKTVAEAFDKLDEALKLDPGELGEAIEFHKELTQKLKDKGLIHDAFLQGSLARKTMLAPLRDIDKVILLSWEPTDVGPGSARRAAEAVQVVIRRLYPECRTEIGKHCVKLDRGEGTFGFDLVPAIDLGDDVLIIDTEQDRWERSNTRTLIRTIQGRNHACNGRFVRQVRFAKLFVREQLEGTIPGLHVEKFAFDALTRSMPHDEALAAILAKGAALLSLGAVYTDPTGVDQISKRLDPKVRSRAANVFADAARKAQDAVAAAQRGEHNAAIAIWWSMLGDEYPKPSESQAIEDLGRGTVITSIITRVAPAKPPTTRSWSPMPWC
jgi:hypothetical protein